MAHQTHSLPDVVEVGTKGGGEGQIGDGLVAQNPVTL